MNEQDLRKMVEQLVVQMVGKDSSTTGSSVTIPTTQLHQLYMQQAMKQEPLLLTTMDVFLTLQKLISKNNF